MPRSTVGPVLTRYQMPLLAHLDQATGLVVRRPKPVAYQHPSPGDLVHLDIKKLGRTPDGGGHKMPGRTIGNRHNKKQGRGYAFLHHTVDDHSRLVCSEIHTDETQHTVTAFWRRAHAWFDQAGINITAVLTDNGSATGPRCSPPSSARSSTAGPGYRPQTNGKVERFNSTLVTEWAYTTTYLSDEARAATLSDLLHF